MNNLDQNSTSYYDTNDEALSQRITHLEKNLPKLDFSEGLPQPDWNQTSSLKSRMSELDIPGLSIAIIDNFQVEWGKCYGIRDKRTQNSVSLETLFEAGSASKFITSICILKHIERGILSLDVPVNHYLKTWKIPENQYTKENPITIRHLLSHTAGINRPNSMFTKQEGSRPTLNQILNGEFPATNDPVNTTFIPGSNHEYSNFGYLILQKIIEDVSNQSFPDVMKTILFNPLGLEKSTFEYPGGNIAKNIIAPHDSEGIAHPPGVMHKASGHGGFLTNPLEFGKLLSDFMKSYNEKSQDILTTKTTRLMLSSQYSINPAKYFGWNGQGLGIFLIMEEDELFISHPGTNMPGATCMMMCDVNHGKGAVLMANSINGELLNLELLFAIAKEYHWPRVWLFKK